MWVPGGQSQASILECAEVTWVPLTSGRAWQERWLGALCSFLCRASHLRERQGLWVAVNAHVCLPQ